MKIRTVSKSRFDAFIASKPDLRREVRTYYDPPVAMYFEGNMAVAREILSTLRGKRRDEYQIYE
jgi:hypothetical protein